MAGGTGIGEHERSRDRVTELIDAAAELLLERGLVDLSLRSMATALGTSHRMLLYYFSSREELVASALDQVQDQMQRRARKVLATVERTGSYPATRALLTHAVSEENEPFMRLVLDSWPLAVREPETYGTFVDSSQVWLPLLEEALISDGIAAADANRAATLVLAATNGLLVERQVSANGDTATTFELLWTMLERIATPA